MTWDFNADEVFEIAVQIEINGSLFYQKAAENVNDPDTKKFLLELAEMEINHQKTYTSMQNELLGDQKSHVFDPWDETALYLKALADTRIFYEKEIDTSSVEEVLKEAIRAEKDSISFYVGMKDMVPDDFGKDKIEGIIKEEMTHVRMLSEKLLALL